MGQLRLDQCDTGAKDGQDEKAKRGDTAEPAGLGQ